MKSGADTIRSTSFSTSKGGGGGGGGGGGKDTNTIKQPQKEQAAFPKKVATMSLKLK